ncbi:MAG TPA: hypothetical protein DEQ28_04325 [Clostridiales bacterium]|nr:hypothetical protein [Clostridiales bacterium]
MRGRWSWVLVVVVVALAAASGCRRAPPLLPRLEWREVNRAHLYLGNEDLPARVYAFPGDLGDLAEILDLYSEARLGEPVQPGEPVARLVFFRVTPPPVTLTLSAGATLTIEHPQLKGPRGVISTAMAAALGAMAGQEEDRRRPAGKPPPAGGQAPRVVSYHLEPRLPPPGVVFVALRFDRAMDWESVAQHLRFAPELPGVFTHEGDSLLFFVSGYARKGEYTVTLGGEARSADGLRLGQDYRMSFSLAAAPPADAELRDAVARTLAADTLTLEREAGPSASWTWLPVNTPAPVGGGATVFAGRHRRPHQTYYLRGDEAVTVEGYRDGDRVWIREEVAGQEGTWVEVGGDDLASVPGQDELRQDLLDVGRWGNLAELARAGSAFRLAPDLLGVRLPELDAQLGRRGEWEEGVFVSYSLVVRLGPSESGAGLVVREIALRLVYHRPDEPYPFSFLDDLSRFEVGGPVNIDYPPDLNR